MKRILLFIFTLLFLCNSIYSQFVRVCSQFPVSKEIHCMPAPPIGERWVLDNDLSDEFDGKELNEMKWNAYNPHWIGRPPGLFMKSQVSVSDGFLKLKGSYMPNDTTVYEYRKYQKFNIATACVTSKNRNAGFGYYECRFKANKSTLSTTFWMTSNSDFTFDLQPKNIAPGRFSQELDICECIGKGGNFRGNSFSLGMNSHVHFWYTPLHGVKENIIAEPVLLKPENGKIPSDDFNIYGCWFKDKSNACFYLNNNQAKEVSFDNKKDRMPFYFPLKMNLTFSVETYPSPWVSLPSREELSVDSLNTSYYDWVHSYFLLDAKEKDENNNNQYVFKNEIYVANKSTISRKNNLLTLNIHYTSPENTVIEAFIYNMNNIKQFYSKMDVLSGYGNIEWPIRFNAIRGKNYKIVCYLKSTGNDSNEIVGDSFIYKYK